MDRSGILDGIYSHILEHGELTEKQDILDSDNKVYTKKIPVDIIIDKVVIKFVSVSGYEKDLSDTSDTDVRVNIKNYNNDYLNLFSTSISDKTLEKILNYLKEHV